MVGMRPWRWIKARLRTERRWSRRHRVLPWLAAAAAVACIAGLLIAIYGPLTDAAAGPTVEVMDEPEKKAAAINAVRQTLLATTAGAIALIGLVITGRSFLLARRGQLTDRYTKAIAQLASDKLEERLGGIYALEHLMIESPRDHTTVMDVLAAFIREHAPSVPLVTAGPVGAEALATKPDTINHRQRPPTDVQAALTVLGRRPDRREPHDLDLTDTDLRGAILPHARFAGVNLGEAQLQGADLRGAQLQGANLSAAQLQVAFLDGAQLQNANLLVAQLQGAILPMAQLQGADLYGAQLQDAFLAGAQLEGASLAQVQLLGAELRGAQLQDANLAGAQLQGASLAGAQLRNSRNLKIDQILLAGVDETTELDTHLRQALNATRPPSTPSTANQEPAVISEPESDEPSTG